MNFYQTPMNVDFDGETLHFKEDLVTIDLRISPNDRIIADLSLNSIDTEYDPPDPSNYEYFSLGQSLHLKSLPFIYSLNKDTISVRLAGSQLKNNILFAVFDTDYTQSIHYYGITNSTLIGIPDSALLIVKIIGNGPLLSVYNYDKTFSESAPIFNYTNKTIIIKNLLKKQEQIPCFDLLGRKHNLDFISTDGTSTTYSIRSLPPGVYFVSDGKEMVKFLISN
jgi:hypothetical protein